MHVTMQAANEYELVHGPAYWLNRVFCDVTLGMQQRDVGSEFLLRQVTQAVPRHRNTERPSKRPQPVQSFVPKEHERAIARLASKAGGAIQQDVERRRAYFGGGLACHPGNQVWRFAERE